MYVVLCPPMPSKAIIIPGSYCVQLKPGVSLAKFLKKAPPDVKAGVRDRLWELGGFNGCYYNERTVRALRAHPDVASVGHDVMVHAM